MEGEAVRCQFPHRFGTRWDVRTLHVNQLLPYPQSSSCYSILHHNLIVHHFLHLNDLHSPLIILHVIINVYLYRIETKTIISLCSVTGGLLFSLLPSDEVGGDLCCIFVVRGGVAG